MRKIKNNFVAFFAAIITIVIPMFVGIILWNKLPEQIALHFDFQGNPDDYYPKAFAVFGVYLILLAVQLFVSIATASENEKGEGIPDKVYGIFLWICPVVSIFTALLVYSHALGHQMDIARWCMFLIGILYLVLGNYVPKLRPNKFSGVRVKWTFESKKNWEHTNRFSGWMMCILGMVFIIMAMTGFWNVFYNNEAAVYWISVVFVLLLMVSVGCTVLYSYLYYTKHKEDDDYWV